jgi:hypothetical protein
MLPALLLWDTTWSTIRALLYSYVPQFWADIERGCQCRVWSGARDLPAPPLLLWSSPTMTHHPWGRERKGLRTTRLTVCLAPSYMAGPTPLLLARHATTIEVCLPRRGMTIGGEGGGLRKKVETGPPPPSFLYRMRRWRSRGGAREGVGRPLGGRCWDEGDVKDDGCRRSEYQWENLDDQEDILF